MLASAPVLRYGLPDWGNDSLAHAVETKEFANQFWDGELYPRWVSAGYGGLGSPTFFYVPTFSRFAVVWLDPLVRSWDPDGFYLTGLSAAMAILLAAWAVYFWCRTFTSPQAALFGALVYTIQPYHLVVNLYTRGAMGELWGCIFPPLILMAVTRLARSEPSRFPVLPFTALAASYGALVMNHFPTTLCFSLVPIAACLYFSQAGARLRVLILTGFAMLLGIGLAGASLGPGLFDQQKVLLEFMTSGMFDYTKLWLFRMESIFLSQMRLMLLTLATLALVIPCFWLALKNLTSTEQKKQLYFQGGMLFFAIFIASQLSAPIWAVVTPLQKLQFPTRFLQVFIVPVAGIMALSWPYLKQSGKGLRKKIIPAFVAVGMLLWVVVTMWGASQAFRVWRPFTTEERFAVWDFYVTRRMEIYQYLPRTAESEKLASVVETPKFLKQYPAREMILRKPGGEEMSKPTPVSWQPRRIVANVEATEAGTLRIHHLYFPTWTARRMDNGQSLTVAASKPQGFIEIQAPAGRYQLEIELIEETPERIGEQVAMGSALVLVILTWIGWRSRRVQR